MTSPSADDDGSASSGEDENLVSASGKGVDAAEQGKTATDISSETAVEEGQTNFLLNEKNEQNEHESDLDSSLIECRLTEDVYSLIFTVPFKSGAFAFAMFVFLFQATIIALVIWDLLDHFDRDSNPLNVPPGTSPQVQAALALALLLAVATQGDLIAAVVMLQQGYHEQVLELNPFATRFKWFLSSLLQMGVGIGLLLTIFVLCEQSSTVIGMMLNFAALSFISEIDDVAFMLAKEGFISEALEIEANQVVDLKIPSKRASKRLRRLLFVVIYAGLMTGYGIILHQQRSGKFLCQNLFVQFGDGFEPYASAFSGIYDQTDTLIAGRVTYIERRSKLAMIGYCADENAWTFTAWGLYDTESEDDKENPCNWFAKSQETESYDVTTTSDSTWVLSSDDVAVKAKPFQFFVLQCADCDNDAKGGPCSGNGKCAGTECQCDKGWYGMNCEFEDPCILIGVDQRTNSFPENDFSEDILSDEYGLLQDENGELVMVYERPVYVYEFPGIAWSVMMFTGRRWIVSDTYVFDLLYEEPPLAVNATKTELIEYLTDFHAIYVGFPAYFVSDPMDVGTPSDAFSPVELGWYKTKTNSDGLYISEIESNQPIGTSMLCGICDYTEDDDAFVDNGCFVGGECTSEGYCVCYENVTGLLCENQMPTDP